MKARLDTVPADKFPNLYMALQRRNRTDAAIKASRRAAFYLTIFIVGLLIGGAL